MTQGSPGLSWDVEMNQLVVLSYCWIQMLELQFYLAQPPMAGYEE